MRDALSPSRPEAAWLSQIPLPQGSWPPGLELWLVHVERCAADLASLRSHLSPDEAARADRFAVTGPRACYVACRAALRLRLAAILGIEAAEIRFVYGLKGKPFLAPDLSRIVRFNLAHSGAAGLIGITHQAEIGIDLEPVRDRPDLEEIAERFFASAEHVQLLRRAGPDRLKTFYHLWTRKEALLKGRGLGIGAGLREPDFSSSLEEENARIEVPGDGACWSVQDLEPLPGYQAAVAWRLEAGLRRDGRGVIEEV